MAFQYFTRDCLSGKFAKRLVTNKISNSKLVLSEKLPRKNGIKFYRKVF